MNAHECMELFLGISGTIAVPVAILSVLLKKWRLGLVASGLFLVSAFMSAFAFALRPDLGRWDLPVCAIFLAWRSEKWSESLCKDKSEEDVDDS